MFRKCTYMCIAMIFLTGFSCGGRGTSGSSPKDTGSLVINISRMSARVVLPGQDITAASYIITGDGPGDSTFTRTVSGETDIEIDGLASGEWLIHVEALNENGVSIGDGEETVTILAGGTLFCNISLMLFAGSGTIDLSINWGTTLSNPRLNITLTSKGHDPVVIPYQMNLTDSADVYYEVDSGYYTLRIDLYNTVDGVETRINGKKETVRIMEGMVSSKTIIITDETPEDYGGISHTFPMSAEGPEGNDPLSSSGNYSSAIEDPRTKANGLSGASYVALPSVGNTGAVNLNYGIAVPGGRGGIGPRVSLAYSSNSGDGLVGTGWRLSAGLGIISRSVQNGPIHYDIRDTFTFNGERLVKVSGQTGSENGTYRLEIESEFARFELSNAESGGEWRVYDKAGSVSVYGPDNSSRMYHPEKTNKVYSWYFSRVDDLNGNYLYAIYDTSYYGTDHILYLKEIRYTGNSGIYGQPTPARQYVRFYLKDREDSYITKAPGFVVIMNKLLDKIEVGWDNPNGSNSTGLWNYKMIYGNSGESGRPLLKTVKSSRNTTEPEFTYETGSSSFEWSRISNPDFTNTGVDPETVKYFQGDFNGDGISDIAFFNAETGKWTVTESRFDGGFNFRTYVSGFKGYEGPDRIQFFKDNVTADFDGNGRSDIAFYLPETQEFWVAESNGRNFEFRMYGKLTIDLDIFKCEWFAGDFDGNGLGDIILFNEPTGEWILMRSTFRSFEFTKLSKHFMNLFRDDYKPDIAMNSSLTNDTSETGNDRNKVHFFTGDFNGDGSMDISLYDSRDGRWWVGTPGNTYIPQSGGEKILIEWKLYKVFTAPEKAMFSNDCFTGDFNSDGFSDFLLYDKDSRRWIIGETGESNIKFSVFSSMPSAVGDISRWVQGDFNGDGRTDIGFYSNSDKKLWIGEATTAGIRFRVYNNFASSSSPNQSTLDLPDTNWIQGDFNGDGKADIGIFNIKEPVWYFANSTGNIPDIMTNVKNGIGGNYAMEYADATSFDNTGGDGIPDLPMNYKVCVKLTADDGMGNSISNNYQYRNAYSFCRFINGQKESDYFGFGEFAIINSAGQKNIYNYHNVPYDDFRWNRVLGGAIKQHRFVGSDNKEYSRIEYEYVIHEIIPSGAGTSAVSFLVDLARKRTYSKGILTVTNESISELVPGKYELKSKTSYSIDHYRDNIHPETTFSSYAEFKTIEDTNETRIVLQKNLLDTSYETFGKYEYDGRGNVIRETIGSTRGTPRPPDRVYEYEYDEYGNRIKTINKSGSPWRIAGSVFDQDMHQFVTESRVYNGTHQGDYFSTFYILNYGPAFGSPEKITGVNGNSSYFNYDSIGRLIRSSADTDDGIKIFSEYSYSTDFPLSASTIQYTGTGEGNIVSRIYFDGMGREIHTIQSGLDQPGKRFTKSGLRKFDSSGRLIAKGQTEWAADNEIDSFSGSTNIKYPTYYFYDAAGRQSKIIAPKAYAGEAETSVSFIYNDPWEMIEVHSIGRSKRTISNASGEVLYVEDTGTGEDGKEINAKMGFAYNLQGSLVKKMDLNTGSMNTSVPDSVFQPGYKDSSGNNIVCWKYDAFGRLIASNDPDIGYKAYEYNEFGNMVSKTDSMGRTTTFAYDAIGRLVTKTLPGTEGKVDYVYDKFTGSDNARGRLASISDKSQGKVLSYDKLGFRKSETRYYLDSSIGHLPEKPYDTNYYYDLLGRTRRIEYPKDPRQNTSIAVNYAYNSMGLPKGVKAYYGTGEEKVFVSDIDYNEFGQMISITSGNGVKTGYDYDIKGRLTSLLSSSFKNNQTQYMQNVSYTFNIDNSLRSVENNPH